MMDAGSSVQTTSGGGGGLAPAVLEDGGGVEVRRVEPRLAADGEEVPPDLVAHPHLEAVVVAEDEAVDGALLVRHVRVVRLPSEPRLPLVEDLRQRTRCQAQIAAQSQPLAGVYDAHHTGQNVRVAERGRLTLKRAKNSLSTSLGLPSASAAPLRVTMMPPTRPVLMSTVRCTSE